MVQVRVVDGKDFLQKKLVKGLRQLVLRELQESYQPLLVWVKTPFLQVCTPGIEEFSDQHFVSIITLLAFGLTALEPSSELVKNPVPEGLVKFPKRVVHLLYFLFQDLHRQFKVALYGRVSDLLFLLHLFPLLLPQLPFVLFKVFLRDFLRLFWGRPVFLEQVLLNIRIYPREVEVELHVLWQKILSSWGNDCVLLLIDTYFLRLRCQTHCSLTHSLSTQFWWAPLLTAFRAKPMKSCSSTLQANLSWRASLSLQTSISFIFKHILTCSGFIVIFVWFPADWFCFCFICLIIFSNSSFSLPNLLPIVLKFIEFEYESAFEKDFKI